MFTVIIPTHERPLLLRRALQSLVAQTYANFQVIIVDDAGSYLPPFDELATLKGRCTHIIRSGQSGPAESRNMGLALAATPYVMFLDDDDSYEPGHLQALAQHLGQDTPPLLFCDFKVLTEDRTQSPPQQLGIQAVSIADATLQSVYVRNRIPNSCLVYRRDVVAGLRHEPLLPIYEDWDFLLRCLQRSPGLVHAPINSVVIHKSHGEAAQNQRRGNNHDELIFGMTLQLYKMHPAPDMATKLARQAFLAQAGANLGLEYC